MPPDSKTNSHSKNAPAFDVRSQMYRITGVDLTAVDGLDDTSAQTILAEIGTDMSKWPTEKHFCALRAEGSGLWLRVTLLRSTESLCESGLAREIGGYGSI